MPTALISYRTRLGATAALGLWALTACKDEEEPLASDEVCDNGLDDDFDGAVDTEDDDCADAEEEEQNCRDGEDNDGDGDADCDDPDCELKPACLPETDCENGEDDDFDGAADCDDADCECAAEDCSNGMDDDGDGNVDLMDDDCATAGEETDCADGLDDDGDGDVDCDDDDCEFEDACVESDCANGLDDDGDGDADCDDRDCSGDSACDVLVVDYWAIEGGFAYDAASGSVTSATYDTEVIPPYVTFVFANADYLSTGDEAYTCAVSFVYAGTAPIAFETFEDATYGVTHGGFRADLADPDWVATTDCTAADGKRLDPAQVGDDAVTFLTSTFAELGVGMGDANADVQSILDGAGLGSDLPYFGGGGAYTDLGGYYSANYGFGYEADDTMTLVDDGAGSPVLLLASDYDDATGALPHGYYNNRALYFFEFAF
jgi:hypothetical protein